MATVLVAEDDADIRELVAYKLQQAGYEVVSVADGLSAIAAARDNAPDVAIVDVSMPGPSGGRRRLRDQAVQSPRTHAARRIAAGDAMSARARRAGAATRPAPLVRG